jgi:PAS domain S-box-containing protein
MEIVVVKFSNKLSLVVLISGVIVLILSSFTLYNFSYNSIVKSQLMYTKSIANEVSDNIADLLHEKVKNALTLANTPIMKKAVEVSNFFYANLSDEKRKEFIKRLNERWKSAKDPADNLILKFTDNKVSQFLRNQQALLKGEYGEIFLTNKFGALVASTAKLSTFAHGHKYWWLGSYTNGAGAVFFDDRGYDDSVGGYVLGVVVPIREGTEIVGILKCNLNILGSVSQLLSGAEDKLIGKFKLTRSGGMIVFEEGFEPLSTQVHDSIFGKLESKNSESFIIIDSGKKYIVGSSEIELTNGQKGYGFGGTFESIDHKKGNSGESWHVLCYRQMSVVLAPATRTIKSTIFIGFAIILILALVSYLFGWKIAKPLAILDKATKKVGRGDFEYRIDVRRKDEFGTLAHSFNSMANELQQTTTTVELLENEVKHRKQTEKTLVIRDKAISSSINGIALSDIEGNLTYANESYLKMWGYHETEVLGKPFANFWLREKEVVKVLETLMDRGVWTGELIARRKDGSRFDVQVLAKLVTDDKGKNICVVSSFIDITKEKVLQDELVRSERLAASGGLAASISHEINSPLQGIISIISSIERTHKQDEGLAENLNLIKGAFKSIRDIVKKLLDLNRPGKERKQPMNVNNVIEDTVSLLKGHLKKNSVKVSSSLSSRLPMIAASPQQLGQLFLNLINNSVEAMAGVSNGKEIMLKSNLRGKNIVIKVADTGPGIPKEAMENIFDPFYTRKKKMGMGIGLSICHGIIEDHNGSIAAENSSDGGAVFTITLPAG